MQPGPSSRPRSGVARDADRGNLTAPRARMRSVNFVKLAGGAAGETKGADRRLAGPCARVRSVNFVKRTAL